MCVCAYTKILLERDSNLCSFVSLQDTLCNLTLYSHLDLLKKKKKIRFLNSSHTSQYHFQCSPKDTTKNVAIMKSRVCVWQLDKLCQWILLNQDAERKENKLWGGGGKHYPTIWNNHRPNLNSFSSALQFATFAVTFKNIRNPTFLFVCCFWLFGFFGKTMEKNKIPLQLHLQCLWCPFDNEELPSVQETHRSIELQCYSPYNHMHWGVNKGMKASRLMLCTFSPIECLPPPPVHSL